MQTVIVYQANSTWRHAGSRVIRVHATYTADPGSNPGQQTFAACHTPSLPHFIIYPLSKYRCLCLKNSFKKGNQHLEVVVHLCSQVYSHTLHHIVMGSH